MNKPTGAFVGASWAVLFIGIVAYLIGLWNADMQLNEKGYYFTVLMYGLFSAVSLQKSVRDRSEGIEVSDIYFGICWASIGISILLLAVGLWNASLALSEKGFYAMGYLMALFASIAVQKNVRDINLADADQVSSAPNNMPRSTNMATPQSAPQQSKVNVVPRQNKARPNQEGERKNIHSK